jgi:hypothetical protein
LDNLPPLSMRTIIFLPTQGPHLWRSGPADQSDWRAQCRLAAVLQRGIPHSVVYVPSAFQQAGSPSELELYKEQLRAEQVPPEGMLLDPQGLDTVGQCELALAFAGKEQARLIALSCYVHFRRVRYLLKGHPVEHVVACGEPNRGLRLTHLVLGVVFPVLDRIGLRNWWKIRVSRRRLQGRQ